MFCPKCGHEVDEGLSFCGECGFRLNDSRPESKPGNSTMHMCSQILLWATAPVLLLLRMVLQEQDTSFSGWRMETYYYLPSEMKVALMVFSIFTLGVSLYLESKSRIPKVAASVGECIIVLFACICIVMIEF